jgi:hypothetical protein
MKHRLHLFAVRLLAGLLACGHAHAQDNYTDLRGNVTAEWEGFWEDEKFPHQHDSYLSLAAEPELIHKRNNGDDLFTFKPFYRVDQHDNKRTHGDIRELSWIHAERDWELTAGIGKVFWGVTEAVHLVDIINQTDFVENTDGEDKLGQPMVNLALIREWGVVDLFVLPYFRERTFRGREGRPRFGIPVDNNDVIYENSEEEKHVDFAIRWSHSLGDWDVGIAHFNGTSREPRFVFLTKNINPVTLLPKATNQLYEQINQTSIDMQATKGSWLWKLEAYTRSGQGDRYTAAAGGFEYTIVGVRDTEIDVGVISEYLYDGRDDEFDTSTVKLNEPFSASIFDDDVVFGLRFTFNDTQSTELLATTVVDREGDGVSYNLEASRRLGDSWKLSMEVRGVAYVEKGTILASFDNDDRVRLELTRHF